MNVARDGACSASKWHPLCLVAALLLSACAGADPNVEVVRFWALGREGEVVEQLLTEFHRRHPAIRVDVQKLPFTGAHQKMLTAFAADATPDLCQLGNTWVSELAALGALEPLAPYVAASALPIDDFFPGIWDTNRIDEELFGVPWYVDTRLLFYRRDLLAQAGIDEPPRDWNAWRRALAAVKANAGDGNFSILLPLNEYEPLLALTLQQPASMLSPDGTHGNFDTADFRRALGFYLEIFREGWAPKVGNTQISNVWDEFGRGFFSFYISGPWNIAEFRKRLPADLQDDWMTAPLPGPDGDGASIAGGSSLVIFRASEAKDAAWKVIEYMAEPDTQLRFHQLTGNLPPRRSTWMNPQLANDPLAKAFGEQLERARPTPKVPEWERIADELRLVAEQAVHGRIDIDEAVAELDRRADAILEKRRWILSRQHTSLARPSAARHAVDQDSESVAGEPVVE